jgi:transposase-like protein
MPRRRPPYPPEFRLEAVRLLRSGARSPKQLAAELGCSAQTLSKLAAAGPGRPGRARRCAQLGGAAAVA